MNKADQPYPGLPASTVEQIKQGTVQSLVDWLRVSAP